MGEFPSPNAAAPDISLLHPRLVELLATQRLSQLFGSGHDNKKSTGSSPLRQQFGKGVNGLRSVVSSPPLSAGELLTCVRVSWLEAVSPAHCLPKLATLSPANSPFDCWPSGNLAC